MKSAVDTGGRILKTMRKAMSVLRRRPMDLVAHAKSAGHFWAARPWILWQARMDPRLEIGANARIQSADILQVVGPDARISVGDDVILYRSSYLIARDQGRIDVGRYCTFGGVVIHARSHVEIGDYVLFSWGVHIQDYDAHAVDPTLRRREILKIHDEFVPRFTIPADEEHPEPPVPEAKPIRIEDDVWVGANVTILKGVTIGRGSVIGSGSLVTKDIPPMCIAVGNPARVVREIEPGEHRAIRAVS